MPNIVIEKNGQTYRFGLHEDNSVTNWQSIVITYQGKDCYARIGDDSTPLKVTKGGREYSVQYNPVAFNTYSRYLRVSRKTEFHETVFLPKGNYHVNITANGGRNDYFRINNSGNYKIHTYISGAGNVYSIKVMIDGVLNEISQSVNYDGTMFIERTGD